MAPQPNSRTSTRLRAITPAAQTMPAKYARWPGTDAYLDQKFRNLLKYSCILPLKGYNRGCR